jgi:hypothetical protein
MPLKDYLQLNLYANANFGKQKRSKTNNLRNQLKILIVEVK